MKNDEKCFENDKYEGLKFVPNFNENEEFFAGF